MVYEQRKFILNFGDWKAQDQGLELFDKGTNGVMRPPPMVESPPKDPTAEYHLSVGLFQRRNMLSSEGVLQLLVPRQLGANPS